jgi:protein tyrosine phosphatase (PTP) superfamily phosphohydrolase (DUF442 family)
LSPCLITCLSVSHTEVDLAKVRIDNFGQINPNYYRGAQPARRDDADLAALGIKTVVDLQHDGPADEPSLVRAAGMRFFRIPMTTHVPPTREQLALFLQIVNDPANQPVYVHCAGGSAPISCTRNSSSSCLRTSRP